MLDVSNLNVVSVNITRIYLDWPPANDELKKVRLGFNTIWDNGDSNPPTVITSGWDGPRAIPALTTRTLTFEFDDPAQDTGYSLSVEFDNSCSVGGGY
jgi:hypothetical protein